jgi:hypothetical protein
MARLNVNSEEKEICVFKSFMFCILAVAGTALATAVARWRCPKTGTWPCRCDKERNALRVEVLGDPSRELQAEARLAEKQARTAIVKATPKTAGYGRPSPGDVEVNYVNPYTGESTKRVRRAKQDWK